MKKVLLFGGNDLLGKEIIKELDEQGYQYTIAVQELGALNPRQNGKYMQVDMLDQAALAGACEGYDVVVSTLGKAIPSKLQKRNHNEELDYLRNINILEEAVRRGVPKFVYVSSLQSEQLLHLSYFKFKHEFSLKLKASEINYSIIKPPAVYSALLEMIELGKSGKLFSIGKGEKRTNPIHDVDLAKIVVNSIGKTNVEIEAGGPVIYTSREIMEVIQKFTKPSASTRQVPKPLFRMAEPFMQFFSKRTYPNLSFFNKVMQYDTVAPQLGRTRFEEYVKVNANRYMV